eukprot:CAMPEP_0170207766 /NCGR_PEP_ID=MMETSP0116_2-20130129/3462_1 /TAXON_ID=400756 /ORGANISM="Durinskia baltica, Strain CSIRO CS-38" /LENGTH=325 /DNA_ID=CAMNT_0010458227 /DNA_START=44 /DNA_END=1021 /DNA_ORIENTATION=+
MFQALLAAASADGGPGLGCDGRLALDRAALAAHATMLEHGFMLVAAEGQGAPSPFVAPAADGSITLRLLPAGWNSGSDSYSFNYVHPLRGAEETFALKALAISGNLVLHASSSLPAAELLTVHLKVGAASVPEADAAAAAPAKGWQEKTAAGIAIRLLGRHGSTARLGKALDTADEAGAAAADGASASGGIKRPHPTPERQDPGGFRPTPPLPPSSFNPDLHPGGILFPRFFPERGGPPLLWTPDGGLLGPRHPAWGQGPRLGGGGGGGDGGFGLLPRFDPIGPGSGEPDPDHLRVPGLPDFPGHIFQGGAGGRRGMDPDGMFMM